MKFEVSKICLEIKSIDKEKLVVAIGIYTESYGRD